MPREAAVKPVRVPIALGLVMLAVGVMLTAAPAPVGAQRNAVTDELAAQSRKIAALEAEMATLRGLIVAGPRGSVVIGGPRSDRVELRARNSAMTLENDRVTISAKHLTTDGVTVTIKGDSITLDAPEINAKGAGSVPIKGGKIGGN
jgi:uncharacterized protein (DUF2345 family)